MRSRIMPFALGACLVLSLTALGTGQAAAGHFKKLSLNHIGYGYSQLGFSNIAGFNRSFPVRLINPNHLTQVAAVLFYESNRGNIAGTEEIYVGCMARVLTPHASVGLDKNEIRANFGWDPLGADDTALYAETLWAPTKRVDVSGTKTRLADGLGGYMESIADVHRPGLAHPSLFSLPDDAVEPGQRAAAHDCVCSWLVEFGLSSNTFKDFGITCP